MGTTAHVISTAALHLILWHDYFFIEKTTCSLNDKEGLLMEEEGSP